MSLSAAEVPRELERAHRASALDGLRVAGMREGSARRIGALSDRELDEAAGMVVPGPNLSAYFETAYAPDPKNDRTTWLQDDLKAEGGVELQVWCDSPIGTRESLTLAGAAAKAYLSATPGDRAVTRGRLVLERHLGVAAEAARKLRAAGATDCGADEMLAHISAQEAVTLMAMGGLEPGETQRVREASGRFAKRTALRLRENYERRATRAGALAARAGTDAKALREVLGLNYQGEAIWPSPVSAGRSMLPGWGAGGSGGYPFEAYLQVGPNQRQMLLNDVWDEQAKCAYHYARDPVCKQAIKVKTSYVLGRGFSVVCKSKRAQAVVDEYTDRKKMNRLAPRWLNSLGVRGEIILRKVPLGDGRMDHVKISPPTIWEIHTEPENVDAPIDYVQRYRTRYQLFAPGLSRWVERVIPAREILHYKINADDDEVRGRGDPYAALPWHLRFTNYWDARAEKDYATAAFQYYALLDDTMAGVKRFIANSVPQGRPAPGGWLVFNNKVKEVGVVKGEAGASSGPGSSDNGLLNTVAMNYQISKTYLGVEGNSSRAGAAIMVGPAEKGFEDRQDDAAAIFGEMIDDVLAEAQAAGLIEAGEDALDYRIEFPTIIRADADQRIKNVVVGRTQGWVSHETGARMWASEMDIGDTYDYADEQTKIKAEAEKGITLPAPLKTDAPGADWGSTQPGNAPGSSGPDDPSAPRGDSSRGARQIRRQDQAPPPREAGGDLMQALETLRAAGATVVLA